jgi:Invasion associated locus B (IalB) protein
MMACAVSDIALINFSMRTLLLLLTALFASPVSARESLGVFGDWGLFRDGRGGASCYIVSAPSASGNGKGRESSQLVVSRWPRQNVSAQVMAGAGTSIQSAALSTGGRNFKLAVRGDSGWMPDAQGDAQAVAALAASSRASVDGRTARGNRYSDNYSLTGFSEAYAAMQKMCGGR